MCNFCKAKNKKRQAEKDHHVIKATKEISMQPVSLLAVRFDDGPLRADHRLLFMLRWAARASDVIVIPADAYDRGRFTHVKR